jgi:heme-degrading monooxygenase HmoA
MPGADTLRLARDTNDPGQYVSFGRWDSIEDVHAWKASPEFRQRMAVVQENVDRFSPAELEVVATIDAGAVVP